MEYIKSFEEYTNNLNEELFGFKNLKDSINIIEKMDGKSDIKKFFIDFFDKYYEHTNLSVKWWKTIKPMLEKTTKLTNDFMLKILREAKIDYEQTNDIGYLYLEKDTNVLKYKPSNKIKTKNPLFKASVGGN